MAATIAGATAAWMVLWSFLSGGVLDRYARMRPTRTTGFFAACGTHFWRFLRLGAAGLAGLLGALPDGPSVALRRSLSVGDARHDRRALGVRRPRALYLLFGVLLLLCNLVFDYARIRTVVEDRRSAIGALVAGARFVRRHPSDAEVLSAERAGFVLLALFYALVSPGRRQASRSGSRSPSGSSTSCCATT